MEALLPRRVPNEQLILAAIDLHLLDLVVGADGRDEVGVVPVRANCEMRHVLLTAESPMVSNLMLPRWAFLRGTWFLNKKELQSDCVVGGVGARAWERAR